MVDASLENQTSSSSLSSSAAPTLWADKFLNDTANFANHPAMQALNAIMEDEDDGTNDVLPSLPILPLYQTIHQGEFAPALLGRFSAEQRTAFLDLDLWQKDNVDPDRFAFWPPLYAACPNERIRFEFAASPSFGLYLKAKFNIWTFDVEDPQYPDHDNYFLTEDNLLLFEFAPDYPYVDQIKQLIKDLYTNLGVEKAYAHLFKYVAESFILLQEEEYQAKKSRLADFGFVDYYDALDFIAPLPSLSHLAAWVQKVAAPVDRAILDDHGASLNPWAVATFKTRSSLWEKELQKVTDPQAQEFLNFSLIRLINALLVLPGHLPRSSLSAAPVITQAKQCLELGLSYVHAMRPHLEILNVFDFAQLYRVGNSLLRILAAQLKKDLTAAKFKSEEEYFLGPTWNRFIEDIDQDQWNGHKISDFATWNLAWEQEKVLAYHLPFAAKLKEALQKLIGDGSIATGAYYNYPLNEVDYEAILLSLLANFMLEKQQDLAAPKLGVSIAEFKTWMIKLAPSAPASLKLDPTLATNFLTSIGMQEVPQMRDYLNAILAEQLGGENYQTWPDANFAHVGGPLIFAPANAQTVLQ